ncbi:putative BCL-2-associated athanoprotein 7 [Hibiscus syriacus]|uniref:BCL-2-associated athanoprotein 7 n=1 Tax=Hibiscus syriacus TaxID=106335 RepID=A0A6A2ZNX6_HIBSY|nr:putative BCL-2-associated athanoprotein 7 [Hibiscus syriacus]
MTKRYTILQKKLKELESQLNQVLSLPLNTQCHQSLSQDIQQRFLFLNNLLSAEVASRPRNPFHLQHITGRLLELEAAFKEWDSFQSSAPDHVEKGSPCSCTESCLNDDGEEVEAAEEGSSELISLSDLEQAAEASTELGLVAGLDFEGFKEQDEMEHVEKEMKEEKNWVEETKRSMVREGERNGVWFGKSLACGVLIGMILMAVLMVRFSGCCRCYEGTDYTDSLRPT